jgi:hypothetical protein
MDVHQLILYKDKDVERQGITVRGATDLYEDRQYWKSETVTHQMMRLCIHASTSAARI